MAKLNKIARMIKADRQNETANNFMEDLRYTMGKINENHYVPTQSYKPSGMSACDRSVYYEMSGIIPDVEAKSNELIGICESGTDRHETIQAYIEKMCEYGIECKWLDVGEYIKAKETPEVEVISKVGNETKLFSSKYNMRFMCDGLIEYKGEHYIIEIKTESTHKYTKHDEPHEDHKIQATCYSMVIGVPKVIFIYENRDNCAKKAYLFEPQDYQRAIIERKIDYINQSVENKIVPPKDISKCMYCNYKRQCNKDGV